MSRRPKILTITKRTAQLCATQPILLAAGFEMITATNLATACDVIKSLRIKGVIICKHSWSEQEIQVIATELIKLSDVPIIMQCPGCKDCDETAGHAGTLQDTLPVTTFVRKIKN